MEAHIQNIELINAYLNKRLSLKEVKDFENKLKTDDQFRLLYEEHIDLLVGIKRQKLKAEIKLGKQRYFRGKWMRYFGFGSIVIILGVICFNLFNSEKNTLINTLNFEADYTQQFKLASDSILEVKGVKGTLIRFHPNDLETNSGEQFSGDSLTLELIELTKKQDLLLANAQTVSNGKWLISGGAFKIDIKANNDPLVLKEGKTIDVTFPKNTKELNMELFYGERNEKGYMNWDKTNLVLIKEAQLYVILYKDTTVLDTSLTKRYGVDMYRDLIKIDSLGFLTIGQIKNVFPRIKNIENQIDTLRVLERFFYLQGERVDLEDGLVKTDSVIVELIKREDFDKVRKWSKNYREDQFHLINDDEIQTYVNYTEEFYKNIKVSKLGWINIDKFSPEEEKVNVKLDFNLKINHCQIYLIDERNNTVLNVYNNEINLPINRSFKIMAFGMKDKQLYGFKKSVRYKKNGVLDVNYKKINESQIKGFMALK